MISEYNIINEGHLQEKAFLRDNEEASRPLSVPGKDRHQCTCGGKGWLLLSLGTLHAHMVQV